MNLDKTIDSRRSVRDFKDKKVKWAHVLEAIDATRKGPFAGNNNTLKFLVVQNPKTKEKLADLSDQLWIADASIIIVVCSDDSTLEKIYFDRGERYARQQAGAAIQNFLLKITDLKLSSCWIGAYPDELVKQALKIPAHINIEAILPIGYAKFKTKAPKKASLERILFWETWFNIKKPTPFKDPRTQ